MTRRRVVITGLGSVSPFGVGVDKLWENVSQGKSGIKPIKNMDTTGHTVLIAGEVHDFEVSDYLDKKEARRMDRFTQFGVIAANEAAKSADLVGEDGKIDPSKADPDRVGVIVGSAAGGMSTIETNHLAIIEKGPTKCSPFTVPMMIVDIVAGRISIALNARGVNKSIVTACATASHCIGDAFRAIQYGDADVVFAGGSDAVITALGMGGFTSARTLSHRNDEPEKASRPFDKGRDGFVMAEGAGILALEELEHAKKRGAKILGEIVGYGASGDASDIVAPHPEGEGAARAMKAAINDAGILPEQVTYVNTHGTSTPLGDIAETLAIKKIFGDYAKNGLIVSSSKSMTGHLLGAAGGVEAIICLKSMETGIITPTINLDDPDEKCDLDYVPHKPRKVENVNVSMSNSFGFGGHNASLVFKKFEG